MLSNYRGPATPILRTVGTEPWGALKPVIYTYLKVLAFVIDIVEEGKHLPLHRAFTLNYCGPSATIRDIEKIASPQNVTRDSTRNLVITIIHNGKHSTTQAIPRGVASPIPWLARDVN
jgi:hypothetical protein